MNNLNKVLLSLINLLIKSHCILDVGYNGLQGDMPNEGIWYSISSTSNKIFIEIHLNNV